MYNKTSLTLQCDIRMCLYIYIYITRTYYNIIVGDKKLSAGKIRRYTTLRTV